MEDVEREVCEAAGDTQPAGRGEHVQLGRGAGVACLAAALPTTAVPLPPHLLPNYNTNQQPFLKTFCGPF